MAIHYLEIVTENIETVVDLYEGLFKISFGPQEPEMGHARIARKADGTLIGIRKPLAAHEGPIVRTYTSVADIHKTVTEAEQLGAIVAYPPTEQGSWGTFSIMIHGGVQHGLWQR